MPSWRAHPGRRSQIMGTAKPRDISHLSATAPISFGTMAPPMIAMTMKDDAFLARAPRPKIPDHGYGEAARHIPFVGHRAHQLRHDGAAHDRHDDEGRCLLGARTQAEDPRSWVRRSRATYPICRPPRPSASARWRRP